MMMVWKVARCWPKYKGDRWQTGRATSLLVSLGVEHLLSCMMGGEEVNLSKHHLKENGMRFVRYVKGMKT